MDIKIKRLIINGWTAPMHSTYNFSRKKTYVKTPSRSNTGQLKFGEKVFIPYFSVSWNYMKMENFTKFMELSEEDEVIVEYLDTYSNEYKYAKFAIQQPEYNQLYVMQKTNKGVLGLELVFDGTLNDDFETVSITLDANGGIIDNEPPTINVPVGFPFIIPDGNLYFSNGRYRVEVWNSYGNGIGTNYEIGLVIYPTEDMTLYAIWG